jgi:stalled ribosome rescue protein Dom34
LEKGSDATVMSIYQSIVWIDEMEAHLFRMDNGLRHESTIDARNEPVTSSILTRSSGEQSEMDIFFFQVARALDKADEILVVGPSTIKSGFVKYMNQNDHARDPRILGVETISHPGDSILVGFAKLYFTNGCARRRPGSGS